MMLAPDLRERVAEFEDLGFDAIPLRPGSKRPLRDGWQNVAPSVQWQDAPGDCNIGLRAGGVLPFAVIDCDAADTAQVVARILAGMGYYHDAYPLIRTASGEGRHVYVRMAQPVKDGHSFHVLKRDVGRGEFRYGPGSQVVGVGSIVDGREYALEAGDLRQLPALDLADARMFADFDAAPTRSASRAAPDVSAAPKLARYAQAILTGQADAIARYPSRSEADQALLTDLWRKAATWDTVLLLFLSNPTTGKFRELRDTKGERAAVGYLRHSWDKIVERAPGYESAGRLRALAAQRWELAQSTPKGPKAKVTRDVFLACADIAAQAGAMEFAAPVRRVAEGAGIGEKTAWKYLRHLIAEGRLERMKTATGNYGATYKLAPTPPVALAESAQKTAYGNTSSQPPCEEVFPCAAFLSDDVWRTRGLGKTGRETLRAVTAHPDLTAPEVAKLAGCSDDTARRLLRRMARLVDPLTGEVIRLVAQDGKRWRALAVADWQAVARAVGTDGAGERQKQRHERERQSRQRAFLRAREGTTPESTVSGSDRKRLKRSHEVIDALRSPWPDVGPQGTTSRVM